METSSQEQFKLFKGIRDQQIDPWTGQPYPWWEPNLQNCTVDFNPSKYDPAHKYEPRGDVFFLTSNLDRQFEDPLDLDNLRIIDPEAVKKAFEDLVEAAKKEPGKKLAIIIGTGGTISMGVESGSLVPKLNVNEIMGKAGDVAKDFASSSLSLPKLIDSSQMEIDYVADIAIAMTWIKKKIEKDTTYTDRFSGFMVCHGTDTCVQSQTYLSFMLGPDCPFNVFYVVAQKTAEDKGTDVGANVALAFQALKKFHGKNGLFGVCAGGTSGAVFNGSTSKKIDDKKINLLQDYREGGPTYTPSEPNENLRFRVKKDIYEKELTRDGKERQLRQLTLILRGYSVANTIPSDMGNNPATYEAFVRECTERFIIIDTFGSFTANKKIVDAIMRAAEDTGKLVFATNPLPRGDTGHAYADAQYLVQRGVIPLKMLKHAAFAKLLWADAVFGADIMRIIKFMTNNVFCDEQLYDDQIVENSKVVKTRKQLEGEWRSALRDNRTRMLPIINSRLRRGEKFDFAVHGEEHFNPAFLSWEDMNELYERNDAETRALREKIQNDTVRLVEKILDDQINSKIKEKKLTGLETEIFRNAVRLEIESAMKPKNPKLHAIYELTVGKGEERLVKMIYHAICRVLIRIPHDIDREAFSELEPEEYEHEHEAARLCNKSLPQLQQSFKEILDTYEKLSDAKQRAQDRDTGIPRFGVPSL